MGLNDKKIGQLSDSMAGAVTEGIADSMRPVFKELTEQVRKMMEGVQAGQEASMQRMADAFLEEMKRSSASMFDSITAGMKEVCDRQSAIFNSMQDALDGMENNARIVSEAGKSIAEAAADIKQTQSLIKSTVEAQNEQIAGMGSCCDNVGKSVDRFVDSQNGYAADTASMLESRQKDWIRSSEAIMESAAGLQQYVADVKMATEQLASSLKEYTDTVTREAAQYRTAVNNDIEETFKAFDTEMAGIARRLGESAAQISEAAIQIPRALKGSIDELGRTINK